jgi:hypothetical protein
MDFLRIITDIVLKYIPPPDGKIEAVICYKISQSQKPWLQGHSHKIDRRTRRYRLLTMSNQKRHACIMTGEVSCKD